MSVIIPIKISGLEELEKDMKKIVDQAPNACKQLTDDICTSIKKEIKKKTNSNVYSNSQSIEVPDDTMLPRLEALAILEAEKFADALKKELNG